jgi:hypothetical protein
VSNTLAIAAVTAALQNLLQKNATTDLPQSVITDLSLGNVRVTVAPLDRTRNANNKFNQINLCLYLVAPNAALRNVDLGGPRPPLALELHYLVSTYGNDDDDRAAHLLLGQAMRLFHDRGVLPDAELRAALRGNDIADQIDAVRLSPRALSLEDLARVFGMYQTPARPSFAYTASVVLIDSAAPRRVPLPVLRRGADGRTLTVAPDLRIGAAIEAVEPPQAREFALLGDALVVRGSQLAPAIARVRLTHLRLGTTLDLTPAAGSTDTALRVTLPTNPAALASGVHSVSVVLGERTTNTLLLALAPEITTAAPRATRSNTGVAQVTLDVRPAVLPNQQVALILDDREIPGPERTAVATQLVFRVPAAPLGDHFVRVRVDAVDSDLVDRNAPTPTFHPRRLTITA